LKILIIKPSSLGDVFQALPVLRLLRAHFPEARISWWINREFASWLGEDPDLDEVIPFERRNWTTIRYWRDLVKSLRRIREESYDWVIDLQALARSGLIAWVSGGKLVIGLDDPREGAPGFYDLRVPRPSARTHAVDWYLEVLRVLKVPVDRPFTWLHPNAAACRNIEVKWAPGGRTWCVINPGSRWENKRWPVEYFQALTRCLAVNYPQLHFAVTGGKEDQENGAKIAATIPGRTLDLTGQTSLAELIEWIRLSAFMVTNDTGPMHAAAALGKPVAALFGPTDPRRTGPYGQIERSIQISLPCIPCLKSHCAFEKPMECLRAIAPAQVMEVIRGMEQRGEWRFLRLD
jgi:heptosyltransferase I